MATELFFGYCPRCGKKYSIKQDGDSGEERMTKGIEFAVCPRCGRDYQEGVDHSCSASDVEAHRAWTVNAMPVSEEILQELRALREHLEHIRWELEHARLSR